MITPFRPGYLWTKCPEVRVILTQGLRDPSHDILRAGQGDGVAQGPVPLGRADLPAVGPVLRPPLRQAHEPLTFQLRGKTNTAARRIVLVPKLASNQYMQGGFCTSGNDLYFDLYEIDDSGNVTYQLWYVSFENGTSEKVMDLGSDSDHYSLCDGVNNELCFNHLSSDGISYCMYDPQSKTMSDPFFVDSSSSGNSMIQDGYLFVLDEQANSVQRIRLSDKEQASASFTVKEGFGAPSMRYLFDGNLMITEAQTLAADIPTDGSYDMCSYILDFDTRNCTEFTLQTPYNNRPVYVLTTIGDTCYVATDYKTYTPTSVSEDGTVSNFDYVANIYAFITKQDYINSNQNGYLMVKDAFE